MTKKKPENEYQYCEFLKRSITQSILVGKLALLTPVVKYEKMHQFKMNPAIYSKHSNNFSRLLNVTINVNVCNELVCHFLSKQVILTNLSAYGNEGL